MVTRAAVSLLLLAASLLVPARAQAPGAGVQAGAPPSATFHTYRILVVAQTKGFEHDSVPDAMATIWKMGHETRLWDATLRTDTELITKNDPKARNMKTLNYFDALVFASTTGELDLTDDQKRDMLAFIH